MQTTSIFVMLEILTLSNCLSRWTMSLKKQFSPTLQKGSECLEKEGKGPCLAKCDTTCKAVQYPKFFAKSIHESIAKSITIHEYHVRDKPGSDANHTSVILVGQRPGVVVVVIIKKNITGFATFCVSFDF